MREDTTRQDKKKYTRKDRKIQDEIINNISGTISYHGITSYYKGSRCIMAYQFTSCYNNTQQPKQISHHITSQNKTSHDVTRQDKKRQKNTRADKSRADKPRP